MYIHSSKYAFLNVPPTGIQYGSIGIYIEGLVPLCLLSSAGVAPLSPGFLKLLSDTVTTFAVFPSWMYLLGGDDNCMLSVPSSTCDPHISCWQGGDICQAIATAAFTLFSYELRSSSNNGWSPFNPVLLSCYLLHDSRLFGLTLRPSAPVFRCHRVS